MFLRPLQHIEVTSISSQGAPCPTGSPVPSPIAAPRGDRPQQLWRMCSSFFGHEQPCALAHAKTAMSTRCSSGAPCSRPTGSPVLEASVLLPQMSRSNANSAPLQHLRHAATGGLWASEIPVVRRDAWPSSSIESVSRGRLVRLGIVACLVRKGRCRFDWPARILEVLSGARALVTRDLGSRAPV